MDGLLDHTGNSKEDGARLGAVGDYMRNRDQNRKVMNCLKQEMRNIRDSMSKMIRNKSNTNKGLKVISSKFLKTPSQNQNPSKSPHPPNQPSPKNCQNCNTHQNNLLHFQKTQEQNQHLLQKISQLQHSNSQQIQTHNLRYWELQEHNRCLVEHVRKLDRELEGRDRRERGRIGGVEGQKEVLQDFLNPQLRKDREVQENRIENLMKTNRHQSRQISRLLEKLKALELLNGKQAQLIQALNQQKTQQNLHKFSAKYQNNSN